MKVWELPAAYVIRLNRGDEVIESLRSFAEGHGCGGSILMGLGALSEATVGFYDRNLRQYRKDTFHEDLEICQMSGSLSTMEDLSPYIHLHVTLGRADLSTLGGHLFRGTVSVTGEFYALKTGGEILRAFDPGESFHLLSGTKENA